MNEASISSEHTLYVFKDKHNMNPWLKEAIFMIFYEKSMYSLSSRNEK